MAVLEILNNLTTQVELKEEQKSFHNYKHIPYLQLAQVRYKRQILQHDSERVLRTAVRAALPSMATPRKERTRRDVQLIDIMLSFLRNIAQIEQPGGLPNEGDDTEISRSALIDTFQAQDIFPLILSIASSIPEEFDVQDVYVMELLFHLLKGIDPEKLFMEEKRLAKANTNELKSLIQKEKAMLAGYAKHAPSRHNRFGTMVWVKRDGEKVSTVSGQDFLGDDQRSLLKMDKSKKWDKPKMRARREEDKELPTGEFDLETPLSTRARTTLRSFVEDFLDSSFNPLFGHLRKPFELMATNGRVLPSQQMPYFYLISWFLRAQCARNKLAKDKQAARSKKQPGDDVALMEQDSFAIVATVLNQQTFVLLNKFMQESIDMKEWRHLNAGMKCLTQVLKTVQEMADSPFEDDQDIAENIQNRIFYEASTHDKVLTILRNYKDQGFGYLDACTELAHVFLRMLERYSKQNVDLQVRSIRRARKQKRKTDGNEGQGDNYEDRQDDVVEAQKVVTERKFDFHRFAAKFATQPCIDTFVAFTRFYNDLALEQLKRAHRYLHRVAFKMEQAVILFRVDYLQLFMKMIKGPNGLDPASPSFKEWEELVRHLFRSCIKKIDERPELVVEMLFTKISSTMFYLEHGYDRELPTSRPRAPAELEVKPGMDKKGEFGVAVSILLNQSKMDALAWLKNVLQDAADERKAWEDVEGQRKQATAPQGDDPLDELLGRASPSPGNADEAPAAPSILVKPDNDERRLATFKDNKLRLLMTLCGLIRMGEPEDPDASWIIPSSLRSEDLLESRKLIGAFEFDPPSYDEGKSAVDFVRSKAAAEARKRKAEFDDDTEGDEGEDDILFPAGGPTARKAEGDDAPTRKRRRLHRRTEAEEADDEEVEMRREKRRQNELEKRRKIKSELMVHDSDDESDAERDNLFFSKEEQVRNSTSSNILKAMKDAELNTKAAQKRPSNGSGKKGKKRKALSGSENDSASESEPELREARVARRSSPMQIDISDDSEGEATDTPLSSPHHGKPQKDIELPSSDPINPSQEDPAIVDKLFGSGNNSAADSDEDDMPTRMVQRRNVRSGFVIDSDSE